jgi:hypothetical protein
VIKLLFKINIPKPKNSILKIPKELKLFGF